MTPQRDLSESEAAALRAIEARYGPQRAGDLMFTDEGEAVAWVRDADGRPRLVANLTATNAAPKEAPAASSAMSPAASPAATQPQSADGTASTYQVVFRSRLAAQGAATPSAAVPTAAALTDRANSLSDQARAKAGPEADACSSLPPTKSTPRRWPPTPTVTRRSSAWPPPCPDRP